MSFSLNVDYSIKIGIIGIGLAACCVAVVRNYALYGTLRMTRVVHGTMLLYFWDRWRWTANISSHFVWNVSLARNYFAVSSLYHRRRSLWGADARAFSEFRARSTLPTELASPMFAVKYC